MISDHMTQGVAKIDKTGRHPSLLLTLTQGQLGVTWKLWADVDRQLPELKVEQECQTYNQQERQTYNWQECQTYN